MVQSSLSSSRIVVVGGGVIGMMTARELAQAGHSVLLLERRHIGAEASWAGGGIVSPLYPWRYPPAVTALAQLAQRAYPALAEALLAETGLDPEYFPCGMVMLEADDARDARVWAEMQGQVLELVESPVLQQRLPGLGAEWRSGLWMPHIANIRNPRLLRALAASLPARGIGLREGAEVVGWERDGRRIVAALLGNGERVAADAFVVCGGAWSGRLLEEVRPGLPVRPVRGQMLIYQRPPGELPAIILGEGRYVIPRRDGHVLCGSTLEEAGFDTVPTEEAHASLRATAEKLWPALRGEEPLAQWAGLRPAAPNGIPFIGRLPEVDNLWLNAGQYRNGLVLAPASARLLADQLLGRAPVADPRPYQVL